MVAKPICDCGIAFGARPAGCNITGFETLLIARSDCIFAELDIAFVAGAGFNGLKRFTWLLRNLVEVVAGSSC